MESTKDASPLYEVERRTEHAGRPGFRINELQISPTQKVPWHYHSNVQDAFYVIEEQLRLFLGEPKEEVRLGPGDTYSVPPGRPRPCHQCRGYLSDLPRAPGHRRVRLRPARFA